MRLVIFFIFFVFWAEGARSEPQSPTKMPELTAKDFKIENIDAYAFAGGGFRALTYEWAVLHTIAKAQKKSLQEILGNKSVGSNSGGSWFMNRLLYDPTVIESFQNNDIKEYVQKMIEMTIANIETGVDRRLAQEDYIIGERKCELVNISGFDLEYYIKDLCEKETLSVFNSYLQNENAWLEFTKAMHKSFNSETELKNIRWTTISALALEFQYAYRRLQDNQEIFTRSKLQFGTDDIYKIPGFPVLSTFTKENTEMRIEVKIPKIEHLNSLGLKKIEKYLGLRLVPRDDKYVYTQIDITTSEIDERIKESITDPKLHSGPSGDALGVWASSYFAKFLTPLIPKSTLQWFENKFYKTIWKPRRFDEVPVGLVDGGQHDNTGITAAVQNLQKYGKETGRIFAIIPKTTGNNDQLRNLFEETEKLAGYAEPYPKIFKGAFKDQHVEMVNTGETNALAIEVETIENKAYGIIGGSAYRLIYIRTLCKSERVKAAGGNSDGNISLLPSGGTAPAYAKCAELIAEDMKNLLHQIAEETFVKQKPIALVQKEVENLVAVDECKPSDTKKTKEPEPPSIVNKPSSFVQLGVIAAFILSVVHL